jgi:hypothetical protein
MASTQCWDCGEISRMLPVPGSGGRMDDDFSRYATFRCAGCGALSVGFFEPDHEGFGRTIARWMPLPGTNRESFADVPPSVADAAAEAVLCMQVGAMRVLTAPLSGHQVVINGHALCPPALLRGCDPFRPGTSARLAPQRSEDERR